ncbi:MAG: V4R domain-containing protein [Cyanobacteriota bacterium]|nr:V4R domain-containing protein [Cyanobacteriota bacterium]
MTSTTFDIPLQPAAQRHNHFSREDFFRFDRSKGTLADWNGNPNVLVSEDFILGLQQGLEEEVGDASASLMYTIGLEWGRNDAVAYARWYEEEYRKKIKQSNVMFLLETWWWPLASQGWGRWEVDMEGRKQGFIFINLFDSAVARTLGNVGKPVCHLYAGLFAGFFTALVDRPLNCIEIQCYSMGETYCKFLLGSKDRIDAAAFWLNEGATAAEIAAKLRGGVTPS